LVFASTVCAACTPNNTSSESDVKQIVYGSAWEPISFYPLRGLDSGSFYGQTLVYEGLVKYDANLKVVPALAESFNVSADGCTITFKLRPGQHFSTGEPLTLVDVFATYKLLLSSAPFRSYFKDVCAIERLGDDQLVLKLAKPAAPIMSMLCEVRILPKRLLDLPDHGKSVLARTPVSSGPFCLKRWESGLELVFVPNKYYWGKVPELDRLVWRVVPSKQLLSLALKTGEIDVAQIDPRIWVSFLASKPQLKLEQFPGSRTIYLAFNLRCFPFALPALRQGITLSINREQICKQLFAGYATVANTDFVPASFVFNPKIKVWPYDLREAYTKLTQAGFRFNGREWLWAQGKNPRPGAQKLAFSILTVKDYEDVAETVAYQLGQINIPAEVHIAEHAILRSQYLKSGDFQTVVWSRSVGPDPDCLAYWSGNGAFNFNGYQNQMVDKLLLEGQHELNHKKRKEIYGQVQECLAEDLPWDFLLQPKLLLVHNQAIKNVQKPGQEKTGLPWDNPLFNAADWQKLPTSKS
jgi:peptide/nickel transport system substrate-binding protein